MPAPGSAKREMTAVATESLHTLMEVLQSVLLELYKKGCCVEFFVVIDKCRMPVGLKAWPETSGGPWWALHV